MSISVARTITRELTNKNGEKERHPLGTLDSCRNLQAYVLLGDSGAGKTTAFQQEADESDGEYITARDFITLGKRNDQKKGPLFIDGLDEARANSRSALDDIRQRLHKMNTPFRLSCRAADWFGQNDSQDLEAILPTEITILHLDPLTEADIKTILTHKGISDPDEFIKTAHQHNLSPLLSNPQILDLLIKAVRQKTKWPESRKEIYEMACLELIKEKNSRHAKSGSNTSNEDLLSAAGYLCAIQLLSGVAGFTEYQNQSNEQYVALRDLQRPSLLNEALKSNIFQGAERRFPIHRSVAEYLGAKYIADLVQAKTDPLPFERVLGLMPGAMAAIASDLRGLCAWLAVHCVGEHERKELIWRDPLGVITYSDIQSFGPEYKKLMLEAFKTKARNMDWPGYYGESFGALGTKDMTPVFQEILLSTSRENSDQKLLTIVLSAITDGQPMPELTGAIEKIIRDPSYLSFIRANAIEALEKCDGKSALANLAKDIRIGIIEDRDDEVLGALLNKLYPDIITPEQIWDYVHAPNIHILNDYALFLYNIPEKSRDNDVPILLDGLVKKPELIPQFPSLVDRLLAKGIETWGDKITTKNLYEWLNLGINRWEWPAIEEEQAKTIASWLTKHPKQYQAIIEYITELCVQKDDFHREFSKYFLCLHNASYPNGMTEWYLEKAKLEYQMRRPVSQYYFQYAVSSMTNNQKPTPDQVAFFQSSLKEYPDLLNILEAMLQPAVIPRPQPENTILQQQYAKERHERADHFRKYLAKIRQGNAPPRIMHDLAKSYRGLFGNINGSTPDARLRNLLNNDDVLVSAVYEGFKGVIHRKDLPTAKQIIQAAKKSNFDLLGLRLPSLISISTLYQDDPASILKLHDHVLESFLAFRFAEGQCLDDVEWVASLIHERPTLVERVLIDYISAMIKEKKEDIKYLCRQITYGKYAKLAPTVLGPLLKAFPPRVSQNFSQNVLNLLLEGAVELLDKETLKVIIEDRRENSSMDAIQKVYWLAAGFVIDPATYTAALRKHIAKKQTYKEDLKNFIQSHWQNRNSFADLTEQAVSFLIELLAPECSPERPLGIYRYTPDMQTADLIYSLIHELQYNSSKTTSELQRLVTLESISHWHAILEYALYTKQVAESRASFKYLTAQQISKTLQNGPPQNATDLSAITMVLLREIANNIRHASTNDYRLYWSRDSKGKPIYPLCENDCRDVLLSHLNPELKRYGVEGHKEGSYPENTRADIKNSLAGGHYHVPIEIKKENHADLWTAIHEQLIKKYVRDDDPRTGGHGIYLVFWFGYSTTPNDPKGGGKPRSAKELEERLSASLTTEESDYIQILVIDCSLPSL